METSRQVNVLVMEQYLLGELGEDKAREFEERLAREPSLRRALEDMRRSTADFLSRFPADKVVPAILNRYAREAGRTRTEAPAERPPTRFPKRLIYYLAPAAAATAALVLLLVLQPGKDEETGVAGFDASPDTTIIKGLPTVDLQKTQLLIFRRRGEEAELMEDGQTATEGDLLQLAYVSAAERYGLILSLDGRGRVTRHFPMTPIRPYPLKLQTKVILPVAIELDDAPLFERFFFITSSEPIDEDEVIRRASELAADPGRAVRETLDLPPGLNQSSLIIYKGKRP